MIERRSKERIPAIEIYTDGSLKKTGQEMTFGGWAYIASRDNDELNSKAGSEYATTNQRMELKAIVEALEWATTARRPFEKVIIYSDSAYAINCYHQEWYIKWLDNGWVNSKDEPVANQDLWEKIVPYFDNFWYDFRKVAGHAGNYWNTIADELAQNVANGLKQNWQGETHGK